MTASDATGSRLQRKILGCLYGGAVGDALGGPAEGRTPDEIAARYGEVRGMEEPWDGPSPIGKGDGRHTDDTHMVRVLSELYLEKGGRLDVFDFARAISRKIAVESRWISEFGRAAPLVERLFHPEKWLYARHGLANADPRLGGVGNMVNCGAAMYAAPVGIVNACDPDQAYADAIDIFGAHQWSYGLEAAGLMACAVAQALRPDAAIQDVFAATRDKAHEGSRQALAAAQQAAQGHADWRAALPAIRAAVQPYDGGPDDFRDRGNGSNDNAPSREHSIEEVPVALAILLACDGDFTAATLAAANYGRDCDSIAGMAGAIAGAMHGMEALPPAWVHQVKEANRMEMESLAADLTALARDVHRERTRRTAAIDRMFQRMQ